MKTLLQRTTDSNFAAVRNICALLRSVLTHAYIKKEDIDALELMCNEACNNLIEHQYNMALDEKIKLTVNLLNNNIIQLKLTDTGIPYTPRIRATIPAPESLPEGGWGLSIIEMLSDNFYRSSDDSGNHFFIEKTCQLTNIV